jgi:hypothetical protein
MLRRLAWSSIPSSSFSATRLNEIIAPSRRYNDRNHISGRLLFTGTHFLGILEGQEWDLQNLWPRLEMDKRHCDVIRIGDVLCGQRWFPEWVLAYTDQSDADVQIVALRSRQTLNDGNHDVAGAQIEPLRSPRTQAAQLWAQIIYPIMCAATAFPPHMS